MYYGEHCLYYIRLNKIYYINKLIFVLPKLMPLQSLRSAHAHTLISVIHTMHNMSTIIYQYSI